MNTLIYTSIYSNLWGTAFGGRPSRARHYRISLKNILNLNPNKVVCFTSKEELLDLQNWFYVENNISKDLLEFGVFDLKNTKMYDKLENLKKYHEITTLDRCFEIQYNKFFWLDHLSNLANYDRVYWCDAGLSHEGLFPKKYSYGKGFESSFCFNVFNQNYLQYLNELSKDGILLLGKNNTNEFYWSTSLPKKYYENYQNNIHVIGGLFGGTVSNMMTFQKHFDSLLSKLLENEKSLFYEELLMSCIYFNYQNNFVLLEFDDWYEREYSNKKDKPISYFFNLFETPYKYLLK